MEIYVQSRGYSEEFDYCWLPQVPAIIKNNRVYDIIQSESPSLVLARYGNQLLLLVTGLESKEKRDFRGRIIRNSVVWVCNDNHENEQFIRGIAAYVLLSSLDDEVDKAIEFHSEYGFKFDSNLLKSFKLEAVNNFEPRTDCKLGKNSECLKYDLANELKNTCLPVGNYFQNTPLVIITGNKSEATLKDARVWRGLSNLVKANENKWEIQFQPQQKKTENGKALTKITLTILFVTLVFLFLLAYPKAKQVQEIQRTSPVASPPIEQNTPANNNTNNQKSDIKSYNEFKALVLSACEQLSLDYNLDKLVPIYRIRRQIGELVTREKFNEWMLNMQYDKILELQGRSLPDNDPINLEDSITTDANGLLYYVKLFSTKAL